MPKPIIKTISRFDGGIIDDIREESDSGFQLSVHFDNVTNPLRLTPYRGTDSTDEDKTLNIIRFAMSSTGKLFGLGVASGNSRPAVYNKAALIGGAWTSPTANEAASGTNRHTEVFFEYKDYFYGYMDNQYLWRWGDYTATPTFTEQYQDLNAIHGENFTNIAQPVQHPADDVAYFFVDNRVHKLDNTSWTSNVLQLPTNLIITDAEPVGNYLAIACKPKADGLNSVVYLWDRDSSLATVSQVIDWGKGDLLYIAYLDGRLIGLTDYFLNDSTLAPDGGKLIIKVAAGERARTIKELQKTVDDTTSFVPNTGPAGSERTKIIIDNRLYFPVAVSDQSETWRGFAVVDSQGRITMDYIENEASATSIQGGIRVGNLWFIAHSGDGSVNELNPSNAYTFTSVYQSQKYTLGDASVTKKLLSTTVMTAPQPTAGTTVLKYRKDNETTWTQIFSNATDNDIRHTAINIESSGATLPQYKEIQFRIESTGGTEITGLKFKSEVISDDVA